MAQATNGSSWITAQDMQRMLSLSKSTVYLILLEEDEIETVQIKRSIRINKASLERWLRKHPYPKWREDLHLHRGQLGVLQIDPPPLLVGGGSLPRLPMRLGGKQRELRRQIDVNRKRSFQGENPFPRWIE